MTPFLIILLFAAVAAGAGFLTFICLHLFVPLIVRAFGEEKFVEMGGLEPVSIALYSGIAGSALFTFAAPKSGSAQALLILPAISLLCVGYAVLWLKMAGVGQGRKEFQIRDGQIVRLRDGEVLRPIYVQQDADFRQTDAYHSYNFYKLEVCDTNGVLARNGYLNGEETQAALREILECARDVPCRALDLVFMRRETETLWWQTRLRQQHAALLCGSLTELSDESRLWWRQWLRPQFPEDGFAEIAASEMEKHFIALKEAYPDLLPDEARPPVAPEELEAQMAALDRKKDWDALVELSRQYSKAHENDWIRLEMLLRRNQALLQIMTLQRFEREVMEAAPDGASLLYGSVGEREDALAVTIRSR